MLARVSERIEVLADNTLKVVTKPYAAHANVTRGANSPTAIIRYKAVLLGSGIKYPDITLRNEGEVWSRGWSEEARAALMSAEVMKAPVNE